MRGLVIAIVVLGMTSLAEAQVELKNDGFQTGDAAAFEGGFVVGEVGASRFIAPEAGRQLLRVRYLFGGATTTQNVLVKVWDDSASTDAPGQELYTAEFQLTGANNAFSLCELAGENIIVPLRFRVGMQFQHDGYPSIARDDDGTIAADKNFILAKVGMNFTWFRSQTLGLTGDWIIRAEIASSIVSATDAGVDASAGTPDAAPEPGASCSSNPQCPVGQYCDLVAMACTFDCRTDGDCGGDRCNSLGQCIPVTGDGGGCGCQADERSGATGMLLVLGLVLFGVRRRR